MPKTSLVVLAIAMPVSHPGILVTNGNSSTVRQALMVVNAFAVEVSMKRGTGADEEAVVTVLVGAKLRATFIVPKAGVAGVVAVFEVKVIQTANDRVSVWNVFVFRTSQTAVAEFRPAAGVISTIPVAVAPLGVGNGCPVIPVVAVAPGNVVPSLMASPVTN